MKVFISHSLGDRELIATVEAILRDGGHEVLAPMDMVDAGTSISPILAAIRSADVFVAVVTSGNSYIFYELGVALGASVPTLIVAPGGELLPADLAVVPYVQLTGDNLRDAQIISRRLNELWKPSRILPTKFESAEAALSAAVREPAFLDSLSPIAFERLLMELFRERGFKVTSTKATRDSGVDFVIESHKKRESILVEVKKLSKQSRVSVEPVRKLLSAVSVIGAPLGMIVSTSPFTAAALSLANDAPIVLRTLEEVLASKSEKYLLKVEMDKHSINPKIIFERIDVLKKPIETMHISSISSKIFSKTTTKDLAQAINKTKISAIKVRENMIDGLAECIKTYVVHIADLKLRGASGLQTRIGEIIANLYKISEDKTVSFYETFAIMAGMIMEIQALTDKQKKMEINKAYVKAQEVVSCYEKTFASLLSELRDLFKKVIEETGG